MKQILRRALCALRGHPDSRLEYGRWQPAANPLDDYYRVLTERCTRCRGVLALSTVLESDWHRAGQHGKEARG